MTSPRIETMKTPTGRTSSGLPVRIDGVAAITSARNSDPRFRSMAVTKPTPVRDPRISLLLQRKDQFMGGRGYGVTNKTVDIGCNCTTDEDALFKELSAEGDDNDDFEISCHGVARQHPTIPSNSSLEKVNQLQPVPAHYHLEKTSCSVPDLSPNEIFSKISDCCRIMSVQIHFSHHAGTVHLKTSEHVEIRLSLWRGASSTRQSCIIIEAQRIKGDSVTYHKYCRHVLDAAVGLFDAKAFRAQEEREKEYYKMAECLLQEQSRNLHPIKEQAPLCASSNNGKPLLALEIAVSLLKKDRTDAHQLGMESLCLLTDPARSGIETALIASRLLLAEKNWNELFDDEEDFEQDESGFHVREAVLDLVVNLGQLITEDCEYMDETNSDDEGSIHEHMEQNEHCSLMHNLALVVLANAFSLLKSHGEDLTTMWLATRASVADAFLSDTKETFGRDLIAVLLCIVESAGRKPHDACLSARCLECLCEVSKDARRRVAEMNGKDIVTAALEVGCQSHENLKAETERLFVTLQRIGDDEEWE